jgi:hypothetical protein
LKANNIVNTAVTVSFLRKHILGTLNCRIRQ